MNLGGTDPKLGATATVRRDDVAFAAYDDPPKHALDVVDAGLDRYNHEAAPLADVRPLAAFATLDDGEIVGGAVGRTWGACCELLQLWVHPDHRGARIASKLLAHFEGRATARGCRVFYLTTLSFQAPGFYQEHGYKVAAAIAGYPGGIVKYLMHKEA